MSVHAIPCSGKDHATRQGQKGWAELLGRVELPEGVDPGPSLKGYLCEACAAAERARPRRRSVPPNLLLVAMARVVHALLEGRAVSVQDRDLLRQVVE